MPGFKNSIKSTSSNICTNSLWVSRGENSMGYSGEQADQKANI